MLFNKNILYPSHVSQRTKPVNLVSEDNFLFQHEFESTICSTVELNLQNVYLLDDTIFDFSTFTFYEAYTHVYGSFSSIDKFNKLKCYFNHQETVEKAIWITQNWTWMYFHWLTDALTRLVAFDQLGPEVYILLPESYKEYPYIVDSLHFLGYQYSWFKPASRTKIKSLILPSHTASPGNYNSFLLNKLRSKFLNNQKQATRQIYISRKKASQRFITNEVEVIDLLKLHGVEIHCFEDYSFQQQVDLMNQTFILIGLHGAGLTNMLFMQQGGKVLEFRNLGDAKNNCYFAMASDLHHAYYYLQCKGDKGDTSSVNITVDCKALKKMLHLLNITQNTH